MPPALHIFAHRSRDIVVAALLRPNIASLRFLALCCHTCVLTFCIISSRQSIYFSRQRYCCTCTQDLQTCLYYCQRCTSQGQAFSQELKSISCAIKSPLDNTNKWSSLLNRRRFVLQAEPANYHRRMCETISKNSSHDRKSSQNDEVESVEGDERYTQLINPGPLTLVRYEVLSSIF